jgi:hypothetical protein
MSLRRQGKDAEAKAALAPFKKEMDVIENQTYHNLIMLYKGEMPVDSVLKGRAVRGDVGHDATAAYGIGNWHLYNGRQAKRKRYSGESWAAVSGRRLGISRQRRSWPG